LGFLKIPWGHLTVTCETGKPRSLTFSQLLFLELSKLKSLVEGLSEAINKPKLRDAVVLDNKEEKIGGIAFVYLDALPVLDIYKHNGGIVYFDGHSYVEAKNEVLENAVFESMRKNGVSNGVLTRSFPQMIKVVMRSLSSREFQLDRRSLCFENGILNAETRELSEFSPRHMVINRIDYNYDANAKCPKWIKFLEEVLPLESVRITLQQYCGLLFADRSRYKLEKLLVLLGSGANGKSVVYEVITRLVGKSNTTSFDIGSLVSGGDKQKNLASINGKILNYCSDLGKKELSGEVFKNLISGEPVQARQIYSESFTAYYIPLLIANANELPITQDYSDGYFRRFSVIPFDVKIPIEKRNLNLHRELIEELPAILNWVLDGFDMVSANGYKVSEPEIITDRAIEYEMNSNSILKFIEDQEYYNIPVYKTHAPMQITAKDLYKQYVDYCKASGYNAFSNVKFAEKLKEKNFQKDRKADGMTYTYYIMPMLAEWDRLASQGLLTMSKEEFSRVVAYKCMGKTLVKPSVPNQRELEYDLPPI